MIFNYYFGNIRDSSPKGIISLEECLNQIKSPNPLIEQIREAREKGDIELKDKLKTELLSYTPCVLVESNRRLANIIYFTGLLALDFNKLESKEYAIEFKQFLFNEYPYIIACWLSSSGLGVRALVKIPTCEDIEEFREIFRAISFEMFTYIGFDEATKNVVLPMFTSYDPDLLHRADAIEFEGKLKKPERIIQPMIERSYNNLNVAKIIANKINGITDSGHPIVVKTAYLLGGYVGGGHISHSEAIQLMENLIRSNSYLSKGVSGYIKTANTMINNGINQPIV